MKICNPMELRQLRYFTKAAETGVITSTVLDDVVVEALNSATTAVQADQIKLAQKADIDAIFTPAP